MSEVGEGRRAQNSCSLEWLLTPPSSWFLPLRANRLQGDCSQLACISALCTACHQQLVGCQDAVQRQVHCSFVAWALFGSVHGLGHPYASRNTLLSRLNCFHRPHVISSLALESFPASLPHSLHKAIHGCRSKASSFLIFARFLLYILDLPPSVSHPPIFNSVLLSSYIRSYLQSSSRSGVQKCHSGIRLGTICLLDLRVLGYDSSTSFCS